MAPDQICCRSLIIATFIHLRENSYWLSLKENLGPQFLSMQIRLANVVKSQEEILLEALEFLQAYIKGITIHFLPNSPNALWEALRPGIKAFTPLIRSKPPPRAWSTNSEATLQRPPPRAVGILIPLREPGVSEGLANAAFPKLGIWAGKALSRNRNPFTPRANKQTEVDPWSSAAAEASSGGGGAAGWSRRLALLGFPVSSPPGHSLWSGRLWKLSCLWASARSVPTRMLSPAPNTVCQPLPCQIPGKFLGRQAVDFFKGSAVTASESPGMRIKTQISAATFSARISGRGSQPGNLPFRKLPRWFLGFLHSSGRKSWRGYPQPLFRRELRPRAFQDLVQGQTVNQLAGISTLWWMCRVLQKWCQKSWGNC